VVVLREFFGPGCATLLEAEVVLEGTPVEMDAAPETYVGPGGGRR
jgi:acetone carboxylase gamma subunit